MQSQHQQILHELALSRLRDEYNTSKLEYDNSLSHELEIIEEQKNKIIRKYSILQIQLAEHYNSVVKKLNAIYDAYDVTISQLEAYRIVNNKEICRKLESSLAEFPKFDMCRLHTVTIIKTVDVDRTSMSVQLNYDVLNTPYSVFKNYNSFSRFGVSSLNTYTITIEFNNSRCEYGLIVDGKFADFIRANVIPELDIIILIHCIEPGDYSYINIIKMSSGRLVYTDFDHIQYGAEFIYCNNTLILLELHYKYIDITQYSFYDNIYKKGDKHSINYIRRSEHYTESKAPSSIGFYGDSRGLYIYYDAVIYYIGTLHSILNTNLLILDNITHKYTVNDTLDVDYLPRSRLLNINYDTYEIIYFIYHNCDYDKGELISEARSEYYTISLGILDVYKFI